MSSFVVNFDVVTSSFWCLPWLLVPYQHRHRCFKLFTWIQDKEHKFIGKPPPPPPPRTSVVVIESFAKWFCNVVHAEKKYGACCFVGRAASWCEVLHLRFSTGRSEVIQRINVWNSLFFRSGFSSRVLFRCSSLIHACKDGIARYLFLLQRTMF